MTRSLLLLLLLAAPARAGLHYSGETPNPLPAKWRGFLLDHRTLRLLAVTAADVPRGLTAVHATYADALLRLDGTRPLTSDQAADFGALHVRLGNPAKAVEVLRPAARRHPDHFRLHANLGTAWQLLGDLDQAAAALESAVRLAPDRWRPFEQAHLKLVRLRSVERKGADGWDDLFGVTYPGIPAKAVPLPADAAAVVQQLCVWLPADGRLLWQAGEIANATGDVRTAASILDGCVTEFALKSAVVRTHRQTYRSAVDAADAANDHTRFTPTLVAKSPRPLTRPFDATKLPPIRSNGVTELPWAALAETDVGAKFPPAYLPFVTQLDGKRVRTVGYARPGGEAGGFLLTEFPVGCWFCEAPDPAGLLVVELADGQPPADTRQAVAVEGVLRVNRTDPEGYLFRLTEAKRTAAD